MIILIDGYNLLKQLFPKLKENLDKQKTQLIKQLSFYKHKKAKDIKEIIVVFDGGPLNHPTREIHSGIVIIYAGQKSTADDWILEFAEKNREKEILLITLDKRLISNCQKYGIDSLNVFDFYKKLQSTLLEETESKLEPISKQTILQKYHDNGNQIEYDKKINDEALDLLMEQASLISGEEKQEEIYPKAEARKSKAQKISKKEKKLYKKLKKL